MKRVKKYLAACLCCAICLSSAAAFAAVSAKNINVANLPEWEVRSADVGGTLLFSDSPEIVEQDGVLYADTVEGKTRLLYYHLNGTKQPKKIVVVLENRSNGDADVTITNYAMGGPSSDYLYVGKSTQEEYFGGKKIAFAHVPANGKQLLHPKLNQVIVDPEKLVYGVFDFETKMPVKVSVMMLPANADPLQFIDQAKVLPADKSHLRGTFIGMDRIIKAERIYDGRRDGTVAVTLADGKLDRYRSGVDATDGSIVENYGNYGILYKIQLPVTGTTRTQYYLNPCGGVYAGALAMRKGMHGRPEMVPTPRDKAFFGDGRRVTDTSFIGEYGSFDSIWVEFSPPGASNLPARLVLTPAQ